MLWRANTQHTPGRNEINPGQETRPVAVCNYLAFHRLPPPLIAHYQPPHIHPTPPPLKTTQPSLTPLNFTLIFFIFFIFLLSNVDEQPGGHYPGADRITGVWLQVKKQWRRQNKQRGQSVTRALSCLYVFFFFFLSVFLSSRVKLLISVAGTVPTSLICQAALSPRRNKRKERQMIETKP